MDKKAAIVVVLVALLIVLPTSLYFLFFRMPIKASAEDMILTSEDIPGWEQNGSQGYGGYGWYGSVPDPLSLTSNGYYNQSLDYSMAITIRSYASTGDARKFYGALDVHQIQEIFLKDSIKGASEKVVFSYSTLIQNYSNENQFFNSYFWRYDFRIDNVVILLNFCKIFKNESIIHVPDDHLFDGYITIYPPTQEWMNQIVSLQVQKIQQHSIHL